MNQNNQSSIQRLLKKNKDKWWVWLVVIALLIFVPEYLVGNNYQEPTQEQVSNELVQDFNGSNFDIFPKQTKIPVDLAFVNDGDTIRVNINGERVAVRYLIIDTPEMNHNEGSPEAYAQEASDVNEEYLMNANQVYIEFDIGPYTDDYDRALVYVYADDVMLNEELVRQGLATVRYVNPPNNSYEELLRDAQADAQAQELNLWSN